MAGPFTSLVTAACILSLSLLWAPVGAAAAQDLRLSTNSGRRPWARSGRQDHDRVAHRILRRVSRCPDRAIRTQLCRVRTSRWPQATGRFSLCGPPSDGKLCRDGDRPYCSRAGKHRVGSRRLEVTGRFVVSPQSERRGISKAVGCGSTGAREQTAHLGRGQQQLQPFRGAIGNGGGATHAQRLPIFLQLHSGTPRIERPWLASGSVAGIESPNGQPNAHFVGEKAALLSSTFEIVAARHFDGRRNSGVGGSPHRSRGGVGSQIFGFCGRSRCQGRGS